MAQQQVKRVVHKPSGKWYWLQARLSWNVKYYSFDGGLTWHRSKAAAFNAAQSRGQLQAA